MHAGVFLGPNGAFALGDETAEFNARYEHSLHIIKDAIQVSYSKNNDDNVRCAQNVKQATGKLIRRTFRPSSQVSGSSP